MPKYSVEIKGIQPLIEHSINSMMLSKSNKVKSSTHDPAEEAEPEDLQGLRGIIHASGGIRPGNPAHDLCDDCLLALPPNRPLSVASG